jgi:hypothetical protein
VLADGSINVGSETLMSRGPGKIQRAVIAVFEAEPENGFLLSELCERVYRGINRVEKKHLVAVARAAHGIPWLAHMKRDTLGGELVFYNPASVVAYGIARLKGDNFGAMKGIPTPGFRGGSRNPKMTCGNRCCPKAAIISTSQRAARGGALLRWSTQNSSVTLRRVSALSESRKPRWTN